MAGGDYGLGRERSRVRIQVRSVIGTSPPPLSRWTQSLFLRVRRIIEVPRATERRKAAWPRVVKEDYGLGSEMSRVRILV